MLSRSLAALLLGSAWIVSTAQAGPVEVLDWVDIKPGEPDTLVVRYRNGNGGLFISHDQGKTLALMCNSAVNSSVQRDGALMLRRDGSILLGVFGGMWGSDGNGCDWENTGSFEGNWINDFSRDPTDPNRVFTVTSLGGAENGIYENTVGSDTWTAIGTQEKVLIGRLHVASLGTGKGKLRFYESIVRGQAEVTGEAGTTRLVPQYVIRHSDDMGETWTEHEFAAMEDTVVSVLAVDPKDPDRIVVGMLRDDEGSETRIDELFWSAKRGEPGSYEKLGELGELGGIDFAPNGRLFYGDDHQNTPSLVTLSALGQAPKKLSDDYRVSCVRYDAQTDKLYVCQQQRFGTADPSTGVFSELYDIRMGETFASCGAPGEVQATCKAQLLGAYCKLSHFFCAPLCAGYGVHDLRGKLATESEICLGDAGVPADAGGPVQAKDAGSGPKTEDAAAEDGCSVSRPSGSLGANGFTSLSCVAFVLVLVARSRRLRSRSTAGSE